MIRIDRISFEFAAPGEDFAHRLYADWDGFCRDCVERVLDECLAAYGRDRMLYELERLDLDLGGIPEADFYHEFPIRLREELLKSLPAWGMPAGQGYHKEENAPRLDNLLHYLEHGYPLTECADTDFSVDDELAWVEGLPAILRAEAIGRLASLVLKHGHIMRRLLWQGSNVELFSNVFAAALAKQTAGLAEKYRLLAVVLETKPETVLRFVRGENSDNDLRAMSELIDSPSVWQLIRTETEEHAEVDTAPYWHGLYGWLVEYYPFNGLAVFGSKPEFIRHLHYRTLTFIRKRKGMPYLSKEELTAGFLLEVFGETYYTEVLAGIYRLQSLNPDGSPVSDSLFDREFYRILRSLSLLPVQHPADEERADLPQGTEGSRTKEVSNAVRPLFESRWDTAEGFMEWINGTSLPDGQKKELLRIAVTGHTQEWITLLRKLRKEDKAVTRTAGSLSVDAVLQGMTQASFHQAAVLSKAIGQITQNVGAYPFLSVNGMNLQHALSHALLLYMQDADTLDRTLTEQEITYKFLALLHFVYNGKRECDEDADWQRLSAVLNDETGAEALAEPEDGLGALSGKDIGYAAWRHTPEALLYRQPDESAAWMESLMDAALPGSTRKRLLQDLLQSQSKELLEHIRQTVEQNTIPVGTWTEWIETEGWQRLAASLSLSVTGLLRQVTEVLRLDERTTRTAWATYIIRNRIENMIYDSPTGQVRPFVETVSALQGRGEAETEETLRRVRTELRMTEREDSPADREASSEAMRVGNSGLCLLAPWFVRLFAMLGYLDGERRKFWDTASKVRAVFLLQYLACGEERDWREPELAFNRLLAALPWNVPLPKSLPLAEEEKQTADGMMTGVKAHWHKMDGTSVAGFRHSFILRDGTLVREEERWLLAVESKAYDILLDTVPWPFRQIRLPWLKKHVQVKWHGKQEF